MRPPSTPRSAGGHDRTRMSSPPSEPLLPQRRGHLPAQRNPPPRVASTTLASDQTGVEQDRLSGPAATDRLMVADASLNVVVIITGWSFVSAAALCSVWDLVTRYRRRRKSPT